MPLSADTLIQLKSFFDEQLNSTLVSLKTNDSDRLIRNKINGFIIALQDRIFELKPKLRCNNCHKAMDSNEPIGQRSKARLASINMKQGDCGVISFAGYNRDYDGRPARSTLMTDKVSQESHIQHETAADEIEQLKSLVAEKFYSEPDVLKPNQWPSKKSATNTTRNDIVPYIENQRFSVPAAAQSLGSIYEEQKSGSGKSKIENPFLSQDVAPYFENNQMATESMSVDNVQQHNDFTDSQVYQSTTIPRRISSGRRLKPIAMAQTQSPLKPASKVMGERSSSMAAVTESNPFSVTMPPLRYPESLQQADGFHRLPIKKVFATPFPKTGKGLSLSVTDQALIPEYQAASMDNFSVTLRDLGQQRSVTSLKKYDARQPRARFQAREGEDSTASEEIVDTEMFTKMEILIQKGFDQSPSQAVFQYQNNWSKVHLQLVTVPDGFNPKKYILIGNPNGKVDLIEHGQTKVYKELPIENMHCSYIQGSYLFLGASNKLFLLDMAQDFKIIGQCSFKRHIFSICSMSATQFVLGQQGGLLAMVEVGSDGSLKKEAENKVTSAIFKVIKTSQNEFALACSGGLYFARYESPWKRFIVSSDFLLVDHLITQVVEVSTDKFAVGCWGVPWVAIVDKKLRTLVKVDCPLADETQCTDLVALPGFDAKTFPYLLQRNSKAINLLNLASLSMHRLLKSENQTGSFEKLVIDSDARVFEQMKLLFVTKQANVVETVIESSFVRQLKEIIAKKRKTSRSPSK